ncbi:MAG: hypothetical protein PWP51_2648 [Clostridiales bacterium]|nr:hypothetical protein [Clostridiales bacterium]
MGWLKYNPLKLSREAMLFDSPLYILKAFSGVLLAYVIFSRQPFIGRDMISVLFGMMLTLEPVSMAGVRSGIDQLKSTVLGGVIGFAVVWIGGVNALTVPLAVSLTLYMALRIQWRTVPAVAIFTAIYMTQYIQYDSLGMPSMPLTLALRLSALFSGILVAVIVNAVFSHLFYRRMMTKRLVFNLEQIAKVCGDVAANETISTFKAFTSISEDLSVLDRMLQDLKLRGHESLKGHYQALIDDLLKMVHYMQNLVLNHLGEDSFFKECSHWLAVLAVCMEAHVPSEQRDIIMQCDRIMSEDISSTETKICELIRLIDVQIREIKEKERSE